MGNGTVYKRGNSWYVNFMTAEGRRVREKVGSNRRLAEKVLSLRHAQVLQGKYFPPNRALGRLAFDQLAGLYIERALPLLKARRQELNRLNIWVQFFGARPIGLIGRAEIEAWRREKMATCKPASINRLMARLRRILNLAVEWELLEESPMAGMKFLRENNARTRYLSIEECNRLITSCIAPHIRAIVTVALHSGMRLGEILNLRWHDLDFLAGFILVYDSKNAESRNVPIDTTLTGLFSRYPRRSGTELIFSGPSGNRLTDIRVGFLNACRRAGITNLHFHDLRHTFASQFMMAGGDLWVLRGILGHKTVQMTLRYSHLSPAYQVKAFDRMNAVWQHAVPVANTSQPLTEPSPVTPASQAPSQDSPTPG